MSWLSKMIHADPVSNFVRSKGLDPIGAAIFDHPSSAPATPAAPQEAAPTDLSQNYLGDSSDSSYGTFAKPFSVQDFYANMDPGYAFRLQQGTQGLVNSAAAGSGSMSGAATKDLLDYNQNSASQEYGNSFNRYQTSQGNIFQRLMAIAGLGQASASNVGANNTSLAGTAGQAIQNQGTAQGGGIVGAGNALTNGGSTLSGMNFLSKWGGNPSSGPMSVNGVTP